MLTSILCIITTYLIGSLSSAIIVCKLWGLPDPRSQGSKNPGATNVLRIGGKLPAILTLLGDGSKGFVPTLVATLLGCQNWLVGAIMLAALCGHIWPIFFGFKGGKGVATGMGAFLGLNFAFGGILISTWALIIFITRLSSLGAVLSILFAPLLAWLMFADIVLTVTVSIMSLLLLYRHKDNLRRLWFRTEAKI